MELFKNLFLVSMLALVMGVSGCATDTGTVDDNGEVTGVVGGDGDGASDCPEGSVLDGAQCTVADLTDELADVLGGTPLEGLVQCLDPTLNDVVDGPDALVQALLDALQSQEFDPVSFQEAAGALADGLTSLGENVPNALLALSGDQDAVAACTGDGSSGGGGGGGGTALDPTQLCVIPVLGEAVVGAAGGSCTGDGGMGGSPLPIEQLCAVPTLGPLLVEGAGSSCDGAGGGGGGSPLPTDQLAQLCAIPVLGPAIVEGAGGACSGGGDGGSPLDPTALCAIPVLGEQIVTAAGCSGGVSGGDGSNPLDPAALCAIPVLGPVLVGAAGSACADGGGDSPIPTDPTALCAIPVLGEVLVGLLAMTDCPAASSTGSAVLPAVHLQ